MSLTGTLYRTIAAVRGVDLAKREATFVVATENPVEMWHGRECLRMSGLDSRRYRANPVLLDAHDPSTIDNVLGSAVLVEVEGRELVARFRFAKTKKGQDALDLVNDGHLRGASIGYLVDPAKVRRLRPGEHDGEGEARVEGPCAVVPAWEITEISMAPVPADKDALLRRSLFQETNVNYPTHSGAPASGAPAPSTPTVAPPAPAISPPAGQPGAPPPAAEARGQIIAFPGDPKTVSLPSLPLTPEETRARDIRALAPEGFREVADRLVLEGVTVEEARKRLLAAVTAQSAPLGTPEPAPSSTKKREWPAEVTDDLFSRSMKGAL